MSIVSSDMRYWDAPEKADILVCYHQLYPGNSILTQYLLDLVLQVSELLGSFGDNELSPECLDGAQRFLKEDGISIPSSYDLPL